MSRAARTALRVSAATSGLPLRTRDTVAVLTPAWSATSVSLVRPCIADSSLLSCLCHVRVQSLHESYCNVLHSVAGAAYAAPKRHSDAALTPASPRPRQRRDTGCAVAS